MPPVCELSVAELVVVLPVVAPEEVDEALPLDGEPLLLTPAPPCEEPDVLARPEDVSELLLVPPVPLSLEPLHPAKKLAAINAKTSCLIISPFLSLAKPHCFLGPDKWGTGLICVTQPTQGVSTSRSKQLERLQDEKWCRKLVDQTIEGLGNLPLG